MKLRAIGHESLYKAGTLHRDISIGNIMLEEDESDGFLIDLDLAVEVNRQKLSGAPEKTGTKVFMAIGVLDGDPHSFMHDLESFFWVLFWICIHYTGPGGERYNVEYLDDWNYEPVEKLVKLKRDTVSEEEIFNKTIDKYSTAYCKDLVPCVGELRRIVFPGGKRWRTEEFGLYSRMKMSVEQARDNLLAPQINIAG